VLQRVAVCCSVCCSVLQCVAVCCSVRPLDFQKIVRYSIEEVKALYI